MTNAQLRRIERAQALLDQAAALLAIVKEAEPEGSAAAQIVSEAIDDLEEIEMSLGVETMRGDENAIR